MDQAYDGWEVINELGKGGQGIVYAARSPERVKHLQPIASEIGRIINQTVGPNKDFLAFARNIVEAGGPDPPSALGALKCFQIPENDVDERKRAIGRLESEIKALYAIRHANVLKLLHSNLDRRFIVTEFHSGGTLRSNLHRFRGNAARALDSFSRLLDGVAHIHEQGAIHRDIKPENIFITQAEELVLGDFGIVFIGADGRLTKTYGERVGSHWWMAPWAYADTRLELDRVGPQLDLYALGKVLWSMIAGRDGFGFWEYQTDENNLELLFPGDENMHLVNQLLSSCIVRRPESCLPTAKALKEAVDATIHQIRIQETTRRRSYVCLFELCSLIQEAGNALADLRDIAERFPDSQLAKRPFSGWRPHIGANHVTVTIDLELGVRWARSVERHMHHLQQWRERWGELLNGSDTLALQEYVSRWKTAPAHEVSGETAQRLFQLHEQALFTRRHELTGSR